MQVCDPQHSKKKKKLGFHDDHLLKISSPIKPRKLYRSPCQQTTTPPPPPPASYIASRPVLITLYTSLCYPPRERRPPYIDPSPAGRTRGGLRSIDRSGSGGHGRAASGVPVLPHGGGAGVLLPPAQARRRPTRPRHRARHPRRRRLLPRSMAAPRHVDRRRRRPCS